MSPNTVESGHAFATVGDTTGLTRDAYTLDLRQYTSWCTSHELHLFAARRVDIETFRGEMETAGRA